MNPTITQIVIIDDHPIVAQGLKETLDSDRFSIRHVTPDADCLTDTPSLFIIELELGTCTGFEIIERILSLSPHHRILVYTMHKKPWIIDTLHGLGIDGAVSKSEPLDTLRRAVAAIIDGDTYFSPAFSGTPAGGSSKKLSAREIEVIHHICRGLTSKEIADAMSISINTVNTYRRRLLTKLGTANTAELICQTKGVI